MPPLIIAHRGDSAHVAENTLASFAVALEVGADLVEFDVQLTKDGQVVVIHDSTVDRTTTGKGRVREDGRKLHPMYLYEVKKPAESKGPWDYYKLVKEVPPEQAFRPLDKGDCPLVTAQK